MSTFKSYWRVTIQSFSDTVLIFIWKVHIRNMLSYISLKKLLLIMNYFKEHRSICDIYYSLFSEGISTYLFIWFFFVCLPWRLKENIIKTLTGKVIFNFPKPIITPNVILETLPLSLSLSTMPLFLFVIVIFIYY